MFKWRGERVILLENKIENIFFCSLYKVMIYDYFIILFNKLYYLIRKWIGFILWVEGDKNNVGDIYIFDNLLEEFMGNSDWL